MKMRFFYCSDEMRIIWNKYGIYFSEKFCNYFADSVKEIMYREAGLKPSFRVSLSVFKPYNEQPMYEPGIVSKINTAISILPKLMTKSVFAGSPKLVKLNAPT